ncbi:Immunoglobulin A1 protease [Frondihabitans sp. 762G35]|uniref:hypothetical protein n=1 Tax=Frondihabitans sp. 762G35 TaxID=1446794 RepID=UPI000D2192E0|nr:hypothetical protein [Frondihabitans sp. 762G35]ARC56410.1 Immunoglobulin A1 protease [Frondihabitans sp. 762G35]
MTWWNSFVSWLTSDTGSRIVTEAILPFVAIVVAGVVAALIARSTGRRVLDLHEREAKSAAVAGIITSARTATEWATLGAEGRSFSQRLGEEASVRLRLLPLSGAGLAASWADHEIEAIKANSATFTFQAEQTFADLRDRLVEWQAKPSRARKLFRVDLERWKAEDDAAAARSGSSTPVAEAPSTVEPVGVAAAPIAPAPVVSAPVVSAPVEPAAADVEPEPTSRETGEAVAAEPETPAASAEAPVRRATGMVSTPVVQPPAAVAPMSPADAESLDEGDREPAFSSPVSAHQVRRRTTPEAADRD